MKKDVTELELGEIFFHPVRSFNLEAIWLVVNVYGWDIRGALSLKTGVLVPVGSGEVCVFDNVDFLDMDVTSRPYRMTGGQIIMGADTMVVKAKDSGFFSFAGGHFHSLPNKKYPRMELHVGLEGKQMKAIRDFDLIR